MCNLHSLIFTLCLVSVFNAFYTIRMCRGHMLSQSTHKKKKNGMIMSFQVKEINY